MATQNQILGKTCEKEFKQILSKKCSFVFPIHKGADFLCFTDGNVAF